MTCKIWANLFMPYCHQPSLQTFMFVKRFILSSANVITGVLAYGSIVSWYDLLIYCWECGQWATSVPCSIPFACNDNVCCSAATLSCKPKGYLIYGLWLWLKFDWIVFLEFDSGVSDVLLKVPRQRRWHGLCQLLSDKILSARWATGFMVRMPPGVSSMTLGNIWVWYRNY